MRDTPRRGFLGRLAALLIRGPDAPFVLEDLEDGLEHDLARGLPPWRARWRYVINVVASSTTMWKKGHRRPAFGFSWLDVKLGLRMLRKNPGLTVVTLFALAVGIPIGLAPSHAADALETPPPFEDAERIVALKNANAVTGQLETPSLYDFMRWRDGLTSYANIAAATHAAYNVISDDGRSAPVPGALVTASLFEITRVAPLLGRTLLPADEIPGAPEVVVIAHALWQSRLAGDPDVVGRTMRISGVPHTVVGVMPAGFRFPGRHNLWLPLRARPLTDDHQGPQYIVFGRLADGVSSQAAHVELTDAGNRMAADDPNVHAQLEPQVVPFTIGLFGMSKHGLRGEVGFYFFQALAVLILVVACVNIGMLNLTRTATRSSELAVRTALGASRTRIMTQLFTESLVLAGVAAALGLVIAHQVVAVSLGWLVELLPTWIDFGITPVTVLRALTLAVLSAAVIGVIPAFKVTRRDVLESIQRAAAGRSGIRFGGLSSGLIVVDVALAVGTIGIAASVWDTERRGGMGIEPQRYLSAELRLPRFVPGDNHALDETAFQTRLGATQQELALRLAAEPGIGAPAFANVLPGMDHRRRSVEIEGEPVTGNFRGHWVKIAEVDGNFFDALEQPILAGRAFGPNDASEEGTAVIVNTSFVERVLGGRNPIGQRVRYAARGDADPGPWYEIVGLVGHLGMDQDNPESDAGLYRPTPPGGIHPVLLTFRVDDDPEAFTPRLRALLAEVDPSVILAEPMALDRVPSFDAYVQHWMTLGVFTLIGTLLTLSVMGIYALMSFAVAQRTREIGIRVALGASRRGVVRTIARRAVLQLGIGALVGMGIAMGFMSNLLDGSTTVPTNSPVALALLVGSGVMILVGGLACVAPTLRALRIRPTEALQRGS